MGNYFSFWLSILLIVNSFKESFNSKTFKSRNSNSNSYINPNYQRPINCPTALRTGRLTELGTRPRCSGIYYQRKQCSNLYCFCVDRITGLIYDATVSSSHINISCNPVSFLIILTIESDTRDPITPSLVSQSLKRVITSSVPGNISLHELNNRYIKTQLLQTSIQLTCVGIPTHTEHRILQILLDRIVSGDIERFKIIRHFSTVVLLSPFPANTMKIETLDNTRKFAMYAESNANPTQTDPATEAKPLFAQPGIIIAIVGGGLAALAFFILLVLFCVYRLRKKDEGSYALDEPKKAPIGNAYSRAPAREFYA